MLPRTYDSQVCSIARTLELVGERWSLLVIRDAFLGKRRFDEFQESLGIARNVLSDRLGAWSRPASSSASATRSTPSATSTGSQTGAAS